MPRIVMLDPATPDRLDRLRPFLPAGWELTTTRSRAPGDQLAGLAGASYAISGDVAVTAEMMAVAGLRAVHKWGVGYDNIDLAAARAHGVRVFRTTGSNAVAVAETTLAMILALNRNTVRGHVGILNGKWLKGEVAPYATTLTGKTVGIVGMGYIGKELARILRGFGGPILYTKRSPLAPDEEAALGLRYAPLDDLLAQSDVVTLNCELNDSTRNLIDAARLALMKPSAILVNAARGGVMVEADVAEAIRADRLRGVASDVFATEPIEPGNPLLGLDRVILTPHVAAGAADNFPVTVARMMANLSAVEHGTPPQAIDILV